MLGFSLLTACSGGGGGNEGLQSDLDVNIVIVSGNNQTSQSGGVFADPLAIRVTNAAGEGIEGLEVTFSETTSYGATIPTSAVKTDSTGLAFTTVTAPATTDLDFVIEARVDNAISAAVEFNLKSDIGVDSLRWQAGFEPPATYTINSSVPMSQFRVEALDSLGSVLNINSGTIQITASVGSYTMSGTTSTTFVAGVASFGNVYYYRPEIITLRATHVESGLFIEQNVTVLQGSVSRVIALLPGQSHVQGVETVAEAVSGTPSTQTAGVPFNVEVRAVDDGFNTVTSYAGTVGLGLSDVYATPPATQTFSSGAQNFSVIFRAASSSHTVSPTSSLTNFNSDNFIVDPNSGTRVALVLPGQSISAGAPNIATAISGTPTDQTAATAFTVSAYAMDDYFNVVNDNSTVVSLSHVDPNATDNGPLVLSGGFAAFSAQYALAQNGISIGVSSAYPTNNASENFNILAGNAVRAIVVLPGQTHVPGVTSLAAAVTGSGSAQTAGNSFNIDVLAVDANYNIDTSYAGSVSVTTSDANDTEPAATVFTAGDVTLSITNVTAGVTNITPVTPLMTNTTSSSYVVQAGTASQAVVVLPGETLVPGQATVAAAISGSPINQTAGTSFSATVYATDAYFNIQTAETGAVSLVTDDPNDTDPAAATFSSGQQTFTVTNVTAGGRLVTPVTGLTTNNASNSYTLLPGAAVQTVVILPGQSLNSGQSSLAAAISGAASGQTSGVSYTATVHAVDTYYNTVTSENGAVGLVTSDANDVEPVATSFSGGIQTFSVTPVSVGPSFTVTASSALTDNVSDAYAVVAGAPAQTIVILPGQTHVEGVTTLAAAVTGTPTAQTVGTGFSVTVKSVDAFFNTTTDNATSVSIVTDDPNDTDPAAQTVSGGLASFTVTNVTAGLTRSMAGSSTLTNNTSSNYVVNAGAVTSSIVLLPGQTHNPGAASLAAAITGTPTTQVAGVSFSVNVYAVDAFFNIVSSETSAVSLTTSDPNDTEPSAGNFTGGQATFVVSASSRWNEL